MKRQLFIILSFMYLTEIIGWTQCNVRTINRPEGVTIRYLNPELVGIGRNCELRLSVSENGNEYVINSAVRYFSPFKKQTGTLKIQFQNEESVELKIISSELASTSKDDVSIGFYLTTKKDIQMLKTSLIKQIIFTELDGVHQIVTLSQNGNVLIRHSKCLE